MKTTVQVWLKAAAFPARPVTTRNSVRNVKTPVWVRIPGESRSLIELGMRSLGADCGRVRARAVPDEFWEGGSLASTVYHRYDTVLFMRALRWADPGCLAETGL